MKIDLNDLLATMAQLQEQTAAKTTTAKTPAKRKEPEPELSAEDKAEARRWYTDIDGTEHVVSVAPPQDLIDALEDAKTNPIYGTSQRGVLIDALSARMAEYSASGVKFTLQEGKRDKFPKADVLPRRCQITLGKTRLELKPEQVIGLLQYGSEIKQWLHDLRQRGEL